MWARFVAVTVVTHVVQTVQHGGHLSGHVRAHHVFDAVRVEADVRFGYSGTFAPHLRQNRGQLMLGSLESAFAYVSRSR